MYDLIETAGAAPPTRALWTTPEFIPRRGSLSSASETYCHHNPSSSMSRSSDPDLRLMNVSSLLVERARAFQRNESPSSRTPRPFVPEMKRMMPFILNSGATSPKFESDGYNPQIPCLPPEGTENTLNLSASKNRHRELVNPPDITMHSTKHLFDATDHVIMRMEFVRPAVDNEEVWVECFERWSRIHPKATADQWRWLYENRVLPTETMETFSANLSQIKDQYRKLSPARPLKSSRSFGSIERRYEHQPDLPSKASSVEARRGRSNHSSDFNETLTPVLMLPPSRSYTPDRGAGYYAKNEKSSQLYNSNADISGIEVAARSRHNSEETSGDETNTDSAEGSESNSGSRSIDTTATSIVSQKASRTQSRGESLSDHFARNESEQILRRPSEKEKLQLEQELESRLGTDTEDGDDEDLTSVSSESTRNSSSSCGAGFVTTPLTAIRARAYSNAQKVQVWRSSSQSNDSEIHPSLMPGKLRTPWARNDNQTKITPWMSALNTPPMSPQHYSDVLEYNQKVRMSIPPRTSSLAHLTSPPTTPQMRYSTYSDYSDLTPGSPSLTPGDHPYSEIEDFTTPTQESLLRESYRDLPEARLDLLMKTSFKSQTPSASHIHLTRDNMPRMKDPPILSSQVDSFSSEDEAILYDLEKVVCTISSTLCLSTPCISDIRIISHSKIHPEIIHPTTPPTSNTSRSSSLPYQFPKHPLRSHPPNTSTKPLVTANKNPITRFFTPNFHHNRQAEMQQQSKTGIGISNGNPRGCRSERDLKATSFHPKKPPLRTTPSAPDLSSFRIIFPSTIDSKRDELYAYLLTYNYLIRLPKPLSSTRTAQSRGDDRLGSPFSSKVEIRNAFRGSYEHDNDGGFPELSTLETSVSEKAAATLGIMSSEESLRTIRLEKLTSLLISKVKEEISRLVAEMDVNANVGLNGNGEKNVFNAASGGFGTGGMVGTVGMGGREDGYVIESTLLRTLVEHVGVCEENGWLSEENGGLWKKILVKVSEGIGIGIG